MSARTVLAAGLAALAVALVVVLSTGAPRLSGTNGVEPHSFVKKLRAGSSVCQGGELIPADTGALQMLVGTYYRPGPALSVVVTDPAGLVTRGSIARGWRQGWMRINLRPVRHAVANARVCLTNRGPAKIAVAGRRKAKRRKDRVADLAHDRVRFEYLRPGRETWWSLLPTITHRFGLGKADFLGSWTFFLAFALVVGGWILAARALLRRTMSGPRALARRIPAAGWICAAVALLNCLAWSLLVPPFHVPDETAHVAYTQYLAETGKLPTKSREGGRFALEEDSTLGALRFYDIVGNKRDRPIWSERGEQALRGVERQRLSRVGDGDASYSAHNPPLYYALEAIPYWLSPSHDLLDRLALMRILSALMAALTVLFVFLFVRELLPGTPWAWTAGGLAAAFQPLFGFLGGGVNNDNLLFLAAACVLYGLARAFARGLTPRVGIAIGSALGLGVVAKVNLAGIGPAVAFALAALVLRSTGRDRRVALGSAGAAIACAALPVALYALLSATAWDHRPLWAAGSGTGGTGLNDVPTIGHGSLGALASYIWQFYLPRLPFMSDQFAHYPLWDTWYKGFIGRFGWLDYSFPRSFYFASVPVAATVVAACGASLAHARASLRRRLPELLTYALAAAGLLGLVALAGYNAKAGGSPPFEQARYLLPLLPLYGAVIALAAGAGGRRWGPLIGAALVMLALAHSLFAQLLTISRFYG